MHQSRSPNSVPSLELVSFSSPNNEAQPQIVGISSTSHLQQQLIKAASPIKMMSPSVTTKNFEESDSTVAKIFPNKERALLLREESKKDPEIESRWTQQETLGLLKIRSEMDAGFQDVTLKGPLWEVVSRKLSELGYNRSAKKCKEKFENIQKYHKRAKEGRAGRQHGKSYCFSGQLEALHDITATSTTSTIDPVVAPTEINTVSNPATAIANTSLSRSNTTFSSGSDDSKVEGASRKGQKRKREKGSKTSKTMMTFFEELMRQVVERQDAMEQQFLEALENRERDRMVREQAWRRQEMVRLTREKELMAQERASIASREQAIITFLRKISGQEVPIPPLSTTTTTTTTPQPSSPQQQQQKQSSNDTELIIIPIAGHQEMLTGNTTMELMSSRWPKMEVHALIKLRTNLEPFYQEGLKGPLWEQIAMGMRRLGYNRSAKKCKEKWENINKYFKRVKESNKNRPQNSRTCPYFHQLDAFYRSKPLSQISRILQQPESSPNPNPTLQVSGSALVTMSPSQLQLAGGGTSNEGGHANNNNRNDESSEGDVGCSNTGKTSGKVQDAGKELADPSHQATGDDHDKLEEPKDENIDQEDDNKNGGQNEDEEHRRM
ncbi:trihelix transcription factor GTL1-like isoform X1 [Phoenix dactylifera]|uniref:Trihelix transcription factor GTL1-like isoform X1 n=1 Tax=Phoenix dactylifera TaxID=42345 RepID=A0A8B7D0T1_PHODC|nr:trihelix transcription factor GTL1-like isoform X1 [Phoenix dactylifera]